MSSPPSLPPAVARAADASERPHATRTKAPVALPPMKAVVPQPIVVAAAAPIPSPSPPLPADPETSRLLPSAPTVDGSAPADAATTAAHAPKRGRGRKSADRMNGVEEYDADSVSSSSGGSSCCGVSYRTLFITSVFFNVALIAYVMSQTSFALTVFKGPAVQPTGGRKETALDLQRATAERSSSCHLCDGLDHGVAETYRAFVNKSVSAARAWLRDELDDRSSWRPPERALSTREQPATLVPLLSPPPLVPLAELPFYFDPVTERALVMFIAHWTTDPEYHTTLLYFLQYAVRANDPADYVFIVQREADQTVESLLAELPSLPPNARYVMHENRCVDFGSYGYLLSLPPEDSNYVDRKRYKYFIYMNGSPLFSWVSLLLTRLRSDPDVRLVALTTNECPYETHLQGQMGVTDLLGLSILERAGIFTCKSDYWDAVWTGEIASSVQLMDAGFNLRSMPLYADGIDWRRARHRLGNKCKNMRSHPVEWGVDGVHLDPFDVLFTKVRRVPKGGDSLETLNRARKYTAWSDEADQAACTSIRQKMHADADKSDATIAAAAVASVVGAGSDEGGDVLSSSLRLSPPFPSLFASLVEFCGTSHIPPASSAPLLPVPIWRFCCADGGTCGPPGTVVRHVRFGAPLRFVRTFRTLDSSTTAVQCNTETFGVDPAPGVAKWCEWTGRADGAHRTTCATRYRRCLPTESGVEQNNALCFRRELPCLGAMDFRVIQLNDVIPTM